MKRWFFQERRESYTMGSLVAEMCRRMPPGRLRDLTRTALLLRQLSEEEMLRRGLDWIGEALRLSSNRSLASALSEREDHE